MAETRRFYQPVAVDGKLTAAGGYAISGTGTIAAGATLTSPAILAGVANEKITEYASDGAIAVESGIAVLTKTSAGAYTLAAPTVAGQVIKIVAGTSFAHVVTGTNLFWAGETGGPFNKITTAAFIGSGAICIGWNSLWLVIADQIATVGD